MLLEGKSAAVYGAAGAVAAQSSRGLHTLPVRQQRREAQEPNDVQGVLQYHQTTLRLSPRWHILHFRLRHGTDDRRRDAGDARWGDRGLKTVDEIMVPPGATQCAI